MNPEYTGPQPTHLDTMMKRSLPLLVALLAFIAAAPVAGQARDTGFEILPPPVVVHSETAAGPEESNAAYRLPVANEAGGETWTLRRRVLTGALIGGTIGLAVSGIHTATDSYCRDPDMFPCWPEIPFLTITGAGLGALVGLVAGPPRKAAD